MSAKKKGTYYSTEKKKNGKQIAVSCAALQYVTIIWIPEGRGVVRRRVRHELPATIRVTIVVITVVASSPLWTLSVVEIGGFLTTCCFAAGTGLSRQ